MCQFNSQFNGRITLSSIEKTKQERQNKKKMSREVCGSFGGEHG